MLKVQVWRPVVEGKCFYYFITVKNYLLFFQKKIIINSKKFDVNGIREK